MPLDAGQDLIYPAAIARPISQLIIHCTATPSGKWLSGCAPVVIDAWHKGRGFHRSAIARRAFNPDLGAIGYHYLLDIDGRVWTGRHVDEVGAHVAGHNTYSLGVCLVGGAEKSARYTQDQWDALSALVRRLLPLCKAGCAVLGHRDLSPDSNGNNKVEPQEWVKTCPGFDVAPWVARGMKPLPFNVYPDLARAA